MESRAKRLRRFARDKVRELRGRPINNLKSHALLLPEPDRPDGLQLLLIPDLPDSWQNTVERIQQAVHKQNPWGVCLLFRQGSEVSLHLQTSDGEGESWVFQVRPPWGDRGEMLSTPERQELKASFFVPPRPRNNT